MPKNPTSRQKAASAENLKKARARRKKKGFSPFTNEGMHLYTDTGKKADAKRIAHFKDTMKILQGVQRRKGVKVSKMPRGIKPK